MNSEDFRKYRSDFGLSVKDMARETGLDERAVRRVEKETKPVPKSVAKLLEVTFLLNETYDVCFNAIEKYKSDIISAKNTINIIDDQIMKILMGTNENFKY